MIKLEKIFEEHSRRLTAMEMGAGNVGVVNDSSNSSGSSYVVENVNNSSNTNNNNNINNNNLNNNAILPDLTQTCKMQANTQKDVQDINF